MSDFAAFVSCLTGLVVLCILVAAGLARRGGPTRLRARPLPVPRRPAPGTPDRMSRDRGAGRSSTGALLVLGLVCLLSFQLRDASAAPDPDAGSAQSADIPVPWQAIGGLAWLATMGALMASERRRGPRHRSAD